MRLLISIILIALLGAAAEQFLPWWAVAVVAFAVVFFMKLNTLKAILAGFLGVALLWYCWAFYLDGANGHILSGRMARLFSLPGHQSFLLLTGFVGGLAGGMGGWSGAVIKKAVSKTGSGR